MLMTCKMRCPCKWGRNTFSSEAAWEGSLTFIHGTFFEVLVCVGVSQLMVDYWDDWSQADKVSILSAGVFLVFLSSYLLFGLYFVCCKSADLALSERAQEEERHIARCNFLHQSLAF
mmetsp:Transcript_6784/g.7852  ORF Transcript_6784/g.7852 Transcript_6784/m.7852 type:complete len:117 (-) Transcript_6784:96-446(-)